MAVQTSFMKLHDKKSLLLQIPGILTQPGEEELNTILEKAQAQNPWFTAENITQAFEGIQHSLTKDKLERWLSPYPLAEIKPLQVGIVMAGNIPLVGLHDLLSVLLSGHKAKIKLSSQDGLLLPYLIKKLIALEPTLGKYIQFVDQVKGIDAIIATGSDNSARYFKYYFSKIPHLIRQNRSSCGILDGKEQDADFKLLAKDIFQYFGLGCRNISKLYVPEGYIFNDFIDSLSAFHTLINHHKYANNYDYSKSIYLLKEIPHFDAGFLLITKNEAIVSPIAVLYFEEYTHLEDLEQKIKTHQNKIQCLVSRQGWYPQSIPFGKAQKPELWDYADNIDTMKFLLSLQSKL